MDHTSRDSFVVPDHDDDVDESQKRDFKEWINAELRMKSDDNEKEKEEKEELPKTDEILNDGGN